MSKCRPALHHHPNPVRLLSHEDHTRSPKHAPAHPAVRTLKETVTTATHLTISPHRRRFRADQATTVTHVTRFLHPFAKPSRESFIQLERGDGAVLWDSDGHSYIDGMASLWYCNVGHGRSEIGEAVARQISTLETYSCFDPFTNPMAERITTRIADLSPVEDPRIFLCGSGSEAIDTAMKLARVAHVRAGSPERRVIVSRERGYHGTNYGGTSAQGLPANKIGWGELLPDVVQMPSDDLEAMASFMAEHGHTVAAIITEPVQGAGGVWPAPEGYLQGLRRLCDQHGAWLIFDEVITGFGRLGSWFAADRYSVVPDLTTFAKAVTSGYQPLGGVIVAAAVRAPLEADSDYVLTTGYTYSGHAAVCAAADVNLDIIEREGLLERAIHIGERLSSGLRSIADDGLIAEVRGDGAVWAAGLHPGTDAAAVRDRMLANGTITRAIAGHSCTFCPPLVITDEQIDRLVDTLHQALIGVGSNS
ncbi:MAG: aspartate aminotransferase family protein [Ilumatobacteraceae bacterium]|nr:aspartate aminotransferase family protein [Ilumatobacteraceae bacterium]